MLCNRMMVLWCAAVRQHTTFGQHASGAGGVHARGFGLNRRRRSYHAPAEHETAASPDPQVDTATTFYCSAGAGIVGAVFTWIFLPDTTGLDLAEIDRYHRFMLAGQVRGRYHR